MRSNTTRFIVPLLKLRREQVVTKEFLGSFIKWEDFPEEENFIYLAYKSIKYINIPLHETNTVTVTSKGVVLSMYLSEGILKEIEKIKQGQYSKLDLEVKKLIIDFWQATPESLLYSILYKKVKAKDLLVTHTGLDTEEYWPKLNVEIETLSLNKLKFDS